ncbi:hypothetical protein [Microseira sp. BLCC-F43]|uniref:hypothetical protein n=1 Tax=Microseira sp. BLCC-F43 TaxID=3153602 RepID=UPI0035B9F8E8
MTAKKPGFWEKLLVWQLEIEAETKVIGSSLLSGAIAFIGRSHSHYRVSRR